MTNRYSKQIKSSSVVNLTEREINVYEEDGNIATFPPSRQQLPEYQPCKYYIVSEDNETALSLERRDLLYANYIGVGSESQALYHLYAANGRQHGVDIKLRGYGSY